MTTKRERKTIAAHQEGIRLLEAAKAKKLNYESKVWTNLDIANQAGVSDTTVKNFFNGKKIDLKNALAIALNRTTYNTFPLHNPN